MGKFIDITGETFGRLTVLGRDGYEGDRIMWSCRCSCGNVVSIPSNSLKSGNTRSCGCLKREEMAERFTKHGYAAEGRTPEYRAWQSIQMRCYNNKLAAYSRYGGRGIKVCERWKESFDNFLADMGKRPSDKHSIDRFPNNDGDYEPSNCRWATSSEQAYNRRSPHPITFRGQTKPLTHFAKEFNLPENTVRKRISFGWPIEKALTTPRRNYPR